jgi:hypothetical protein
VAPIRRRIRRHPAHLLLEGQDDELSLIGEAQWFISRRAFFKFNCGFGLTEKAPDFAPEIGIMFSF